jgi:hypothetical protein
MQFAAFSSGNTAGRTGDDRYLLGGEFTLLHSTRMQLHPVANLYNFGHGLAFRILAIPCGSQTGGPMDDRAFQLFH